MNKRMKGLDRLTEFLVEDILTASDQEILDELREDGVDPETVVSHMKSLYARAKTGVAKKRFEAAKAAFRADQMNPKRSNVVPLDPSVARARLQSILNRHPEAGQHLTLAARKADGLSDAEIASLLDDLEELGLVPPPGDQGDQT